MRVSMRRRRRWCLNLNLLPRNPGFHSGMKAERDRPGKPLKFPMKFRGFLRHAFGGRLHSDRLRIFRKYWRWALCSYAEREGRAEDLGPEVQDRKITEVIERHKRVGVDESFFNFHM